MAKNQTSQLNKILQTQKWKKFSLSKVYPYMTLSDGTKIEFLLAVWKKSKKCYLVGLISNTVYCKPFNH